MTARLPTLGQRRAAAAAVAPVADQVRLERLLLDPALDDRQVDAVDGVLAEHLHQPPLGLGAEGQDHQAAGVAVQAVDGADRGGLARSARPAARGPAALRRQDPADDLVQRGLQLLPPRRPGPLLGVPDAWSRRPASPRPPGARRDSGSCTSSARGGGCAAPARS